jgi:hypothetical protein
MGYPAQVSNSLILKDGHLWDAHSPTPSHRVGVAKCLQYWSLCDTSSFIGVLFNG